MSINPFNLWLRTSILWSDILEGRESEVRALPFSIIFAVLIFANKLTVIRLLWHLSFFIATWHFKLFCCEGLWKDFWLGIYLYVPHRLRVWFFSFNLLFLTITYSCLGHTKQLEVSVRNAHFSSEFMKGHKLRDLFPFNTPQPINRCFDRWK